MRAMTARGRKTILQRNVCEKLERRLEKVEPTKKLINLLIPCWESATVFNALRQYTIQCTATIHNALEQYTLHWKSRLINSMRRQSRAAATAAQDGYIQYQMQMAFFDAWRHHTPVLV